MTDIYKLSTVTWRVKKVTIMIEGCKLADKWKNQIMGDVGISGYHIMKKEGNKGFHASFFNTLFVYLTYLMHSIVS